MGIAIAYRGRLRDPGLVAELVDDLAAKARSSGWLYKTVQELVAAGRVICSGLEGITLYLHPECEPLHFHFDRDGIFTNHNYHALLANTKKAGMIREALSESAALTRSILRAAEDVAEGEEGLRGDPADGIAGAQPIRLDPPEAPTTDLFKQGSRCNLVNTHLAGPEVHATVCSVLRYVQQRYAPDLEVDDESGYFIDGDFANLEAHIAYIDRMTALTSQAIGAVAASSTGSMSLDVFVKRVNAALIDANNKLH